MRKCAAEPRGTQRIAVSFSSIDTFPIMHWCGYDLELEAREPWRAPEFSGSMIRGAFGFALKRLVCVMRLRACDGCPLEHACVYTTLFETRPPPGAGVMTRYERAPHPFVFVVGLDDGGPVIAGPARLRIGLRLFGDAMRAAPFALRALEEAAERGLGAARTPFRLISAGEEGASPAPHVGEAWRPLRPRPAPSPFPDRVDLRFVTPLRLKKDNRLVTPDTLTGPDIAMNAVRRLGLISGFFGGGTEGMDFPALKRAAGAVRLVDKRLQWRDLVRRSSRQDARLGIGGVVGEARLEVGDDPALAKALAWAPLLHVGKGASMGLGRIEAKPIQ